MSWKQDGLHLVILVGVALGIGAYLIATSVLIAWDGVFYISQAEKLLSDPVLAAETYPVGYAFLLAVAHRIAGLFTDSDSIAVWIVSAQIVTLSCRVGALVFVYLLGRMLVGSRRSFWAVLILTVLPHPARYGSDVLREWPFVLFLAAGFWLLLKALRDRRWVRFGLVGLIAGLGYFIRPMGGQLIVYGLLGLGVLLLQKQRRPGFIFSGGVLLLAGFALIVAPYSIWTGTATPHQLREDRFDAVPVITAVAGRSAGAAPLRFDVHAAETLDMNVEASDPDGDTLRISVVTTPIGTRPVYRFRSAVHGGDFWTISEDEKDRLLTHRQGTWDYQGTDFYAYPGPGDADGLQPVYRFWSPVSDRHFYTIDPNERVTIVAAESDRQWQAEGVAFYAFTAARAPEGAVAIYRFRDSAGRYVWTADAAEVESGADGTVAWCAYLAGPAPDDSTVVDNVFRWSPQADQQGEYQLNIIVSDGQLDSSQLVHIVVDSARPNRTSATQSQTEDRATPAAGPSSARSPGGSSVLTAAGRTVVCISEDLMFFFLVPLCVGLLYRLRHKASLQERVLTIAVIVVNVALIMGRQVWIEPGSSRRYALGLIALTACYIPEGIALMARGLRMTADRLVGDRGRPERGEQVWCAVLLAIGLAICVPKLMTPVGIEKSGYRAAAQWLAQHTDPKAVVAVPDWRISFYAERRGRLYADRPDPRRVDYVVLLTKRPDSTSIPTGWIRRYACPVGSANDAQLVIYSTPEATR